MGIVIITGKDHDIDIYLEHVYCLISLQLI